MGKEFFQKSKPNLDTLYQELYDFCSQYDGFEERFNNVFGKNHENVMAVMRVNENYTLHSKDKKGDLVPGTPIFDFWLDRYCEIFDLALWNGVYHSEKAKGTKKYENVADEASKAFRKKFSA